MIKFGPLGRLACLAGLLLLLLASLVSADAESKKNEIKIDESAEISVGFQDGSWKVRCCEMVVSSFFSTHVDHSNNL